MNRSSTDRGWPWQEPAGSERVQVEDITRDERLQPRAALVPSLTERYKNAMETGSKFPPVTLARIEGKPKLHLVCGWHRFEAATIKLGMGRIQANVVELSFTEARWVAAKDNLQNGHAYTQRGDNRRVFKAYMHARQNVKPDGTLKSYREIEGETQIKKSSLHNWMREDFPAMALRMGEEKLGNRDADAPELDHSGELLRAIDRAIGELENYVGSLADPEARWLAVGGILGAVERMKMKPMEDPELF